ncbi:hypothetical protein CONPUDRAFT_169314 [Coniophora puteana RWD-64-598 SS2]|uniref:Nucleoporin protein Ndc1-Nup n=1 Tax=Coniophora puteana (strain RWD-64-598) TaxID=741705 RepID=A0A5M3M8R6_CONPW|nr:uncharacterized protein CONPUDRAFT_169314 [Coniophora puteana RWD-64-598 SS2]EIW75473.1 hypothetical protein CONPUDRAFT_169314 [Coniophora puteana RWD-64-598 SS2]
MAPSPFRSSTLAAHAAPSIPKSADVYDPLVRGTLSHRMVYTVFAYSAAFVFAWTVLVAHPGEESLSIFRRLINPWTWLSALASWAVGVLPVIVLRKAYLSPHSIAAHSPQKTISTALSHPRSLRALAAYTLSALLLTALHLPNVNLRAFARSKKHPWYFDPRTLFFFGAQIWSAFIFMLRGAMLDRFVFRQSPMAALPYKTSNLLKLLFTVTLFSISCSLAYVFLAVMPSRMFVFPFLLRIPILGSLLRPFFGHFIRVSLGGSSWDWALWKAAHRVTWGTLLVWEFSEALFDVCIPMPVTTAHASADPLLTLIAGTSSSDPIFSQFAWAELEHLVAEISPTASQRRVALFADQKYTPSPWSALMRTALLTLGHDHARMLRRGAPAPPPAAPPVPKKEEPKPPAPGTPLLRKDIFKKPQESQSPAGKIFSSFTGNGGSSNGSAGEWGLPSPAPAPAAAPEVKSEDGDSSVPELFRSTSFRPLNTPAKLAPAPAPAVTPASGPLATIFGEVKKRRDALFAEVDKHLPNWVRDLAHWYTRERLHKVVEASLPNRAVDIYIVGVLTHLIENSLIEDKYGVVQRDIPRTLEALLTFLSSVQAYESEIAANAAPPTPDELTAALKGENGARTIVAEKELVRVETAKSLDVLKPLEDALKVGLGRVIRTFGDKLQAFKFPPRTAAQLQELVDSMHHQ